MGLLRRQELVNLDREGEFIKFTFAQLVGSFPHKAQTITGMTQWTGAGKTTCQRIVQAITKPSSGIETLQKLPSPDGLSNFLDVVSKKNIHADLIASCRQSTIKFNNIIISNARSHAALKRLLLESLEQQKPSLPYSQKRKNAYEAMATLLGENVGVKITISIHAENVDDPKFLSQFIFDYSGDYRLDKKSRPMQFKSSSTEEQIDVKFGGIIDDYKNHSEDIPTFSFLSEFSSPSAIEGAKNAQSSYEFVTFSQPDDTKSEDLEVCTYKYYPKDLRSPDHGGKLAGLSGAPIIFPTKKLFLLVFLEKKLALQSVPYLGTFSTHNDSGAPPEELWFDRFYDHAKLRVLHPNSSLNEELNHSKLDKFADAAFHLAGKDPANFHGVVVEADYPLWSTMYRLYFPTTSSG